VHAQLAHTQVQGIYAQVVLSQLRVRQVLLAWSAWSVRAQQLRLAAGWLAPVVRASASVK